MAKKQTHLKSKAAWGNNWTEDKLDAFTKYVNVYLTIMNRNKERFGWRTLYFDGFAGSGDLNKKSGGATIEAAGLPLLDFGIEELETKVYKGAAERILSLKNKFDYYPDFDNATP